MNKTKYLNIRCSPEQLRLIKSKAGNNVSAWVLERCLGSELPMVAEVVDNAKELDDVKSLDVMRLVQPLVDLKGHRCVACPSLDTKQYDRRGQLYWLCDAHKP